MHDFRYTSNDQQIVFGAGSLERLDEIVERGGWQRLLLVTTGSQRRGGHISTVESALAGRLVATFEQVQPHVPDYQVAEVQVLARSSRADGIIALGGGSVIGMAKALSFALGKEGGGAARSRVIAVPTTYAGSEMTPVYGVTHHDRTPPRKVTVADPLITPAVVLYDPLLTLGLPPKMTASTGINALAHCLEALYSITRNPISTAISLAGIRAIAVALPRCYSNGKDIDARSEMLTGSMLAGMALAHVKMGLHHGLCHVLGGTTGVQHGVANAIILPHALRFNVHATAPQLAEAAGVMGLTDADRDDFAAAEAIIDAVEGLIRGMNLPARLRDTGVKEADLPMLARLALESRAVQDNPRPVTDISEIESILRAAW
jgi:alcohol dehydrogenase class IV